jgi:hypothetical protein
MPDEMKDGIKAALDEYKQGVKDENKEGELSCPGFQAEILSAVLCGGRVSGVWSFSNQPTHRDHGGGLTL